MNYKSTALKCEDCGHEFWADDEVRCPKCGGYALLDQERDDAYTEKLATGHDTCQ